MNNSKSFSKFVLSLILFGVIVFILIYSGILLTKNIGKSKDVVNTEDALKDLERLYNRIEVNYLEPRKAIIELGGTDLADTLPDISKYPLQVENTTEHYIEIFSSPEKAGEKKDGWLIEVAEDFNRSNIEIDGKVVSVSIRNIASGLGMDYIVSGKYVPDAFSPSNELWGKMIEAHGVEIELIEKRLVGNVPGILMSKEKQKELMNKYGSINQKVIIEAVAANEIAMGYTNPLASSTGLNFLLSTLVTFDAKNALSDDAVKGFETFQNNIPYIAYTTMQMRESAESGVLDGFILEYQTYINSPDLRANYVFTPFGYRHDNPVYAIGNLSQEKRQILDAFIEFCKKDSYQKLATEYGFNAYDDYKPEIQDLDGETILQAQKLWKEKKNNNQEIIAVFVADVSGSMDGEPLNNLKKSLLNGAQYIGNDCSIGLVTFSNDVNVNLPIAKFDINHRSFFAGAVEDMQALGGTAMYDGIIVGAKMLMDAKANNPNAKIMLFVLSDGEPNRGHNLNDVKDILAALKIPVYTIGYNADIQALQTLSSINEAASINADSEDVIYKLGSLFNAEM